MGGVLVDEQQLPARLHEDVELQGLPQQFVVRKGCIFNTLNRVFHSFNRLLRSKRLVFCRIRHLDSAQIQPGLIGLLVAAQNRGRRLPPGGGAGFDAVVLGAEILRLHAAVEVGPGGRPRRGHGGRRGRSVRLRGHWLFCLGRRVKAGAVLLCQGRQRRVVDEIEDPLLLGKLHLGLGGVDVYVDGCVGELQVHHAGRVAPREQGVFIGLLHRRLQKGRADQTPVAVEKLHGPVAAPGGGGGHKARDGHVPVLKRNGQQILCRVAAQQGVDAGFDLPVAGGEKLLLPVPDQAHRHLGPAESAAQGGLYAGGGLRPVGFEKLEPGRGVEEQALHLHHGPGGTAGLAHVLDISGAEGHACAALIPRAAGEKLHLAHGGDGGQRLAAKAHGADRLETRFIMELRGRVAQEGDARVLGGHALPVILHADEGGPAVADLHRHAVSPGVKGVFHQLLDDGGRPLHHLAGGDHIRHMRGENVDFGHSMQYLPLLRGRRGPAHQRMPSQSRRLRETRRASSPQRGEPGAPFSGFVLFSYYTCFQLKLP